MSVQRLMGQRRQADDAAAAGVGRPADRLLAVAIYAGRLDIVRRLLAAGVSIEYTDAVGRTPLLQAIAEGREEIARVLVAAGSNLRVVDGGGNGALHLAAASASQDLFMLFLRAGLDGAARNNRGDTPGDIFELVGDDQMRHLADATSARAAASSVIGGRGDSRPAPRKRMRL